MSRPLSVNHSSCVTGCQAKPTLLRTPSANTSQAGAVGLHPHDRGGHRRRRADVARRTDRHVQHVVRTEGDELPGVAGVRIRQVVADRDRRGRRVEVLFDVVEPQEPARGRHVQRAVAHRDAVGLIETAGDHHDAVRLVIAVAIDHGVDLAGVLRSDEHGPLRPERHRAGVVDVLGKHVSVESRRKHQRAKRRRRLTGGRRQTQRQAPRRTRQREANGSTRSRPISLIASSQFTVVRTGGQCLLIPRSIERLSGHHCGGLGKCLRDTGIRSRHEAKSWSRVWTPATRARRRRDSGRARQADRAAPLATGTS